MTFCCCQLAFRVFRTSQRPVPVREKWGLLPSWTWPLLQSALGMLELLLFRASPAFNLFSLSWDSFARAPQPTLPSRVHSSLTSEPLVPFDTRCSCATSDTEDSPRQLASTRSACSDLVVSHHLAGLLRVTALDVLQSKPAGVRCVSSTSDPHGRTNQTWGCERSTFPAARAPYEEPSLSAADTISRWHRTLMWLPPEWCRPEGLSQTLGPLQGVNPPTLLDYCHSPLPARDAVRVLPWVSIPARLVHRSNLNVQM